MTKTKSLHQRFVAAAKVKQEPGTFPWTAGIETLYPEAQANLLRYMRELDEDIADRVVTMERVKSTVNRAWANRWRPINPTVLECTISVPAEAMLYHLQQFEGYKKAHEICSRKDINVCVELKQVDRTFLTPKKEWAVVVDLSKPYSDSPDAALFKKAARDAKKNNKPVV